MRSSFQNRWGLVLGALIVLAAQPAHAQRKLILPRAGQVGVGIQGQYGSLLDSGKLGGEFGSGPGLGVRLKYRLRYERALGLSFERHSFDTRGDSAQAGSAFDRITDAGVRRERLDFSMAGLELYQLFDTRTPTVKLVSAGIGLVQLNSRLSNKETQYPLGGDGFYLSAGAGVERFVYRSWALDLSTRYMAVFHDSKVNHDVQLQGGVIFYASY